MGPSLQREIALYSQGYRYIAGLDEAGRGAWAGPVVAAAVVLPLHLPELPAVLEGVCDSKLLTPVRREGYFGLIMERAVSVGIGVSASRLVDARGIVKATVQAMQLAVDLLCPQPDYLLIDYLSLPDVSIEQDSFPKAETVSLSVAAASVIAKVYRDRLMVAFSKYFSAYGFSRHKGYGTRAHRAALQKAGPSPIHRKTFAPVRDCL